MLNYDPDDRTWESEEDKDFDNSFGGDFGSN